MPETPSREQAIAVLRHGHAEVAALISELDEDTALRPGLGSGEWSVKDLLGHLTSWEEHALGAIDAWLREVTPPVFEVLGRLGLGGLNRQTLEAKRSLPYATVLADFESVHARLLDALAATIDEAWEEEPVPGRGRPAGEELGRILAGQGPFNHAEVHLPDLRAWIVAQA
jgi:hypothetical protein